VREKWREPAESSDESQLNRYPAIRWPLIRLRRDHTMLQTAILFLQQMYNTPGRSLIPFTPGLIFQCWLEGILCDSVPDMGLTWACPA
jgi:hypothetical protein